MSIADCSDSNEISEILHKVEGLGVGSSVEQEDMNNTLITTLFSNSKLTQYVSKYRCNISKNNYTCYGASYIIVQYNYSITKLQILIE